MTRYSNESNAQPLQWRLSQHHEELLRTALRLNPTGPAVTAEQRAIIHKICSAPQKVSFAPEDFVIAIKLALTNAANEVGIRPGSDRNDLLARLVSVCIEEFFRRPSTGAGDAPRAGSATKASGAQEIATESR